MATRNRIIYQSEALYVSPATGESASDSTTATQLYRVQDISHDMDVNRTDIFEFGRLAPLTRQVIEAPTVSLDFSYLLADGVNEKRIGLMTDGLANAISGILNDATRKEKNYYVTTVGEYTDAEKSSTDTTASAANTTVVGFGNAAISNYVVNVAVGDLPTASVTCEAYNLKFENPVSADAGGGWLSGVAPTVNKESSKEVLDTFVLPTGTTGSLEVFTLRPGDVTMVFSTGQKDSTDANKLQVGGAILPTGDPDSASTTDGETPIHIQNFSIEVPLARTPLNRVGSNFPYDRAVDFPLDMTLNISALLADVDEGSLIDLMCEDQETRDVTINCKIPCTEGDENSDNNIRFEIKDVYLQSQNMSATIGDNKTVDLSFTSQFGGVDDTVNGLFISGFNE